MKKVYVAILIILVLGIIGYFLYIGKSSGLDKISNIILKSEEKTFELEDIKIKKNELDSIKEAPKKHKGIEGDTKAPTLYEAILEGKILDIKNKTYPKLKVKLEDESGFYRIRILLFYNKKFIGYMQKNINTKSKKLKKDFYFDNTVVLEGYKTFRDYEGGKINYRVLVWDNNMNIIELESDKIIDIIDNTKPRKAEIYWTYHYSDDEDIEMYSNHNRNEFLIYPVYDMPRLDENEIVKYQYGVKDSKGELLFRAGIPKIEKERKRVTLNIDKDGNYKFFTKTIDKNSNEALKEIRFNVDTKAPEGEIKIAGGVEHKLGELMNIYISAKDNLSGLFRYRLGSSKEDLESNNWDEYKERTKYRAKSKEGIHSIWYQFQDNAFNLSKPSNISYLAKKSDSMKIEAYDGEKQKIIELDKSRLDRGKIKIKKIEEK